MKFIYNPFLITMELVPDTINNLIIEDPKILTEILADLVLQESGLDGRAIFTDGFDKHFKIGRDICFFLNPLEISVDNKKFLNLLFDEAILSWNENETLKSQVIEAGNSFFGFLATNIDFATIQWSSEPDPVSFFKSWSLTYQKQTLTLIDQIVEFLKVYSFYSKYKCLVLVDINLYLSLDEMKILEEMVAYLHITVLSITHYISSMNSEGTTIIVDSDLCSIIL